MAKSAENASRTMLTSVYRICHSVCEHTLANRPHASLWLAKTYVVPAGSLGVKRTTTDWAVLGECGHQLLSYYWFRKLNQLFGRMDCSS
eukprot:89116-Pelagomonas_calceolata.AAC.1